ncbi:MAG: DUF6382 domain-containing protein [Eubacterium sp.]
MNNSFSIENQGINTYLTYHINQKYEIDTLSLGMITNNKIAGISPILYSQLDNEKYFKYNITAKVTAKEFLSGTVNKKRLVGVYSSILTAVMAAEEYMIDINSLLFDLEYIFVDVSTCKAEMICLPILDENNTGVDIGLFFKNIMFSTQFDPTENSDYIAKIMNYLNASSTLDFGNFKLMIDKLMLEQKVPQPYNSVHAFTNQDTIVSHQTNQSNQLIEQVAKLNQPQQLSLEKQHPIHTDGNTEQMRRDNSDTLQQEKLDNRTLKNKGKKSKKENKSRAEITTNNKIQIPNMNIPGQNVPNQKVEQGEKTVADNEKSISLFYLMQHYNKENAALYKAQKANKKTKASKKDKNSQQSFTVPGAPTATPVIPQQNQGMQIPGNMGTSQGMHIPGAQSQVNSAPEQSVPQQNMPSQPEPQPAYVPDSLGQANASFGETVVLNQSMAGAGETTVLGAGAEPVEIVPFLIRSKNNEKILLDKPVFRIGKEKSYVDYFIGDNTAISRSHANIISKDGEYFVVDTNSTNHTYVNGTMIQSNMEVKISHGEKIRLADEDFQFNLY